MRTIAAILIAAFLSGCVTTLADIRASDPEISVPIQGAHAELAHCLVRGMEDATETNLASLTYRQIDEPEHRQSSVVAMHPMGVIIQPLFEVTIKQGTETTLVEVRPGHMTNIARRNLIDPISQILERCALHAATP